MSAAREAVWVALACLMLWCLGLAGPVSAMGGDPQADAREVAEAGGEPLGFFHLWQRQSMMCDELPAQRMTLAERLDNAGRLHFDDDHPIMQEWWFLGRYHGQYYTADGDNAQLNDWENRRFRIGSQARFFDKLTLHAQMVSGFDMEPFYNGFTELWSQWAFDERFALTLGQQKHRFTHDRNVSSRYINTLERSLLVNMFNADYTPAVTASGRADKLSYYTGIFSNATGPDIWNAFTEFNSGYSLLATSILDVNSIWNLDEAFCSLSYLYSDANSNATNLNRFRDGISAALILTSGPGSLISEAVVGLRSEEGDAVGINIQPGYFLTEKLQLATRYQLAISDRDNGLLAQRRYERNVGVMTGELYQAGYLGFNYYIAGHRIKVMNGIEYANLDGQDVWTASIALRVFWGPHSRGPFPMAKTLKPRSHSNSPEGG
jgi:phosphate-selective porin OprO and OprP